MSDLVGLTLNRRYRIDSLIGRGGMADVYRAYDTRRGYPVAIKVLREDLAEDWEFVRRFQAEAAHLSRLAHQNIVRFYSFEQDGAIAFIVMDYVEGDTLRRRLFEAAAPLPPAEALHIARQMAAALHFAHSEGVLHRDVKPGNVMLEPGGRALVADFGIARATDAATLTSYVAGTPAYMSPEQCRGERADERSDVYSLGLVLYEMFVGRRPFVGDRAPDTITGGTHERVLWEQMHADPPPPRQINPALPAAVERVLLAALAKDRANRFPSAAALLAAIETALGHPPPRAVAVPPRTATPPPRRPPATAREAAREAAPVSRFLLLAIGGVAIVIVLAVSLLVFGANNGPAATPSPTWQAMVTATASPHVTDGSSPPSDNPVPTQTSVPTTLPTGTGIGTTTPAPTSTDRPAATHTPPPTSTTEPPPTAAPTPPPTTTPKPPPTATPTSPPPPTATPVPPPAVYLSDDFDGAVDAARWQVYTNGGSAATGGGRLSLSAPSGSVRFPYVYAKGNPFPAAGDFRLRVELQYTNSTWSGTGVVAGTELPANGVAELDKDRPDVYLFSVWQDNNTGLVVAYGGYPSSSTTVYQGAQPDTGRHTVVLRYVDGAYQVNVDGQQVYQSPPTGVRPTALWFGNPVVLSPDNPLTDLNWTGLGIDHVSIEQLP